jgi:hypothetical protein
MEAVEEKLLKGAGKIEAVFQKGFCLDSKVLHYIDSTFSDPSAEGINELLSGNGFEKESLLRLIFSPDESIQFLLEEFLKNSDIGKEDAEKISGYLSARKIQSKIIFPDERGTIKIYVPPEILCEFIDHLNMPANLNDRLAKALEYVSSNKSRTLAKVKIRNLRKEITEKGIDFLCLFFEMMGSEEESIFNECLESALEILENEDDRSDIYHALSIKKSVYLQSLTNAKRFEELLRKNNIETLLLQGVRPVSIDKDTAVRKIMIIDRICLAVFGKTEYH